MWNGAVDTSAERPDLAIDVGNLSIVKILPALAKLIKNPKVGKIDLSDESLYESVDLLLEAISWDEAWQRVISFLDTDMATDGFLYSNLFKYGNITSRGAQVFAAIREVYPDIIKVEKRGTRDEFRFVGDLTSIDEDRVLRRVNPKRGESLDVVAGGVDELEEDDIVGELEKQAQDEKIDLETALQDLDDLLTGMIKKNLGNAILVAGRGGIGKTHTVEQVLHKLGLSDGEGYFKITGAASPAALYRELFNHRKGIILFDDCDSVFDSQDGRNLLKNATDTKKVRKVSWSKISDVYFDPAETDDEAYEKNVKAGSFPKFFNFEGKIIFISNMKKDKLDPDGALRTRAFIVDVDPTNEDVINFMKKICNKIELDDGMELSEKERLEVVDVIASLGKNIDLRKLVRGLNIRAAGMADWVGLIKRYA